MEGTISKMFDSSMYTVGKSYLKKQQQKTLSNSISNFDQFTSRHTALAMK